MQDAQGSWVDAHDGDVHYFGGFFCPHGTSYDCGWAWNGASPWCGIEICTSPELKHWSASKLALPSYAPGAVIARHENGAYGWLFGEQKPLGQRGAELFGSDNTWTTEPQRDLNLEVTVN